MNQLTTITALELAGVLGIKERTVRERAKAGDIVKGVKNEYLLAESVQGYIKFLLSKKPQEIAVEPGDYEAERTRLTKAKADIAEIQAEAMKGKYHEAEAVEVMWTDMLMNCRSKLLAMPTRLAPQIRCETELPVIQGILQSAIYEALTELAAYDPDAITNEYISSRRGDVDAAVEIDGERVG